MGWKRNPSKPNHQVGERTRVLFVHTKHQPPLGADTWVHLEIIRGLDRTTHEVHVACDVGLKDQATLTYLRLRQIPDVAIRPVNFGREREGASFSAKVVGAVSLFPAIWSVLRLAIYVRRQGISIIHTSDRPRDAVACVLLGRITGATCIIHVHVGYNRNWMRGMLQWAIHHADVLISVSSFVGDTLIDAGLERASVHVVHNGIDLESWEPGRGRELVRSELGLDGDTLVVLTVCRLFRSKGASELVRAFHDVEDAASGAVLLVVGREVEVGYLDELRAETQRLGIADSVKFLGHRDDVPEVMASADIFAMPSQYEPFGLVFTEAMAMKIPVIALANGGTVEVVDDGVTGLLSAAGDADALARNLRELLVNPAKRAEYGRRGRLRVQERFTTEQMAAAVADVYALISLKRSGNESVDPVRGQA